MATVPMQQLRALYNQAHNVGPTGHWGAGGAYDDMISRRRAQMINQGFTVDQANARLKSMGLLGNKRGQSGTDKQVLEWAMSQGYRLPGVPQVLNRMRHDASRRRDRNEETPLDRILREAQIAHDRAQAANEARYQQGLGLLQESYDRNTGLLQGAHESGLEAYDTLGQTQKALNEEKSGENLEEIKAYLAERGLLNSTVLPAYMGRNARDLQLLQNSVDENVAQQRAAFDANLAGQRANLDRALTQDQVRFIEARHDKGPDLGQIAQLVQNYEQANRGSGFQRQPLPTGGGGVNPLIAQGMARNLAGQFYGGLNRAAGFLAPMFANHGATRIQYTPRSRAEKKKAEKQLKPREQAAGVVGGPLGALAAGFPASYTPRKPDRFSWTPPENWFTP